MIPAPFDYHRAESAEHAVELLRANPGAKLLAGGHSLLPMMRLRLATPPAVVDIGSLAELAGIEREGGEVIIGALTTHAQIAASDDVRSVHQGLAEAAAAIGDLQVRNCGTLGGSLAHADPAADYPAAALACNATLTVLGPDGERSLPVTELFAGPLQTTLGPDEILLRVTFPGHDGAVSAYEKFAHPASGFAIVGVFAMIRAQQGDCDLAHVAVTGVSDRPHRLDSVEHELVGKPLTPESIAGACTGADAGLESVRQDHYADADYRRQLVRVYARRALERAAG